MHEAQMHEHNAYITLTYANEHLPEHGQLIHRHFQLFMKRLRKHFTGEKIKYYMCGEYGAKERRPHFHACLFGIDFQDKTAWQKNDNGDQLYRSQRLEQLWPYGHSTTGNVTFKSAAYIARYVMKKINGDLAKKHYEKLDITTGEIIRLKPEYNKMSLAQGIGKTWIQKYMTDVYPHGKVVANRVEVTPPKYYDLQFKKLNADAMESLQHQREMEGKARYKDNTQARLDVKEQVLKAKAALLKRKI